ncbi:MAG: heteromeric transposase endonuclease subunit TnsA [Bacillaceae bacterium]|nr:heteromeric transposase endonuclease subunit TnsA [Bacillaceae bacterium]
MVFLLFAESGGVVLSRYRYDWTLSKLHRFLSEGRGKGKGSEYRPWLTVYDLSSRGRATRVLGWKTNRIHHLMTENELLYFYLLEWNDEVLDIREQYPLLGLFEMQHILDTRLLKRLYNKKTGVPYVIITTFLITVSGVNGKHRYIARSIKDKSDFNKPIVQDLFEIQRRYWEANGIDWGVVIPELIPRVKAKNIEWLHPFRDLTKWGFDVDRVQRLSERFLYAFNEYEPVRDICMRFDFLNKLPKGTGLTIYKHLVANKQIRININSRITHTDLSVQELNHSTTEMGMENEKAYCEYAASIQRNE